MEYNVLTFVSYSLKDFHFFLSGVFYNYIKLYINKISIILIMRINYVRGLK